ncbi:MAG: hypothetical protein BMS9Abin14_263 [Gammaproteobacteria bacterium]|nr:MAG: hypothetical protein BMS9Abin14_263 [Gammaproteobacteria bacterium]
MQSVDSRHDNDDGVARMSSQEIPRERSAAGSPLMWLAVFALVILAFYAMDHGIMALQGLPLNLDLTPAQ